MVPGYEHPIAIRETWGSYPVRATIRESPGHGLPTNTVPGLYPQTTETISDCLLMRFSAFSAPRQGGHTHNISAFASVEVPEKMEIVHG